MSPRLADNVRLDLARSAGNEPALVSLLHVYKQYYPDVLLDSIGTARVLVLAVLATTVHTLAITDWTGRRNQIPNGGTGLLSFKISMPGEPCI